MKVYFACRARRWIAMIHADTALDHHLFVDVEFAIEPIRPFIFMAISKIISRYGNHTRRLLENFVPRCDI